MYAEPESERMKMPSLLETDFTTVFFCFYRSFSFEEPVGVALSVYYAKFLCNIFIKDPDLDHE